MADELNTMIMGARLGYDIARDIVKAVGAIIKASQPEAHTELVTAVKNNEAEYPAISVEKDGVQARCFIDGSVSAIENGETTIEEEAKKISSFFEEELGEKRFEDIKDMTKQFDNPDLSRITLEVINATQNEEMLKSVPHNLVADDLAGIARYQLGNGASCVINDGLAKHLGYTPKEILDYGASNIRNEGYHITNMGQMIADMMGMPYAEAEDMFPQEQGMYVITNENKVHGAAGIFFDRELRKQVAEKFDGEDYLILPSSIHETIAVKADTLTPEQTKEMITEINGCELRPEEVLSNRAYHVDGKTLQITGYECAQKSKENAEIVADAVKKVATGAHR